MTTTRSDRPIPSPEEDHPEPSAPPASSIPDGIDADQMAANQQNYPTTFEELRARRRRQRRAGFTAAGIVIVLFVVFIFAPYYMIFLLIAIVIFLMGWRRIAWDRNNVH
jgi:hypothetical protein